MDFEYLRNTYGIEFPESIKQEKFDFSLPQIPPAIEEVYIKISAWDFAQAIYSQDYHKAYKSPVFNALDKLCSNDSGRALKQGTCVYRARIISNDDLLMCQKGIGYNNDQFVGFDYWESKEPPIGCSKSGRANASNSSYFYCAENIETAACEVKPYIADYVSVAEFQIKKDLKLISFVEPSSDLHDSRQSNFFNYMCFCFSNPVKDERDYAITQFLCDEIRKYGFDGVCFRSIFTHDINYVIFNCSKMNIEFHQSKILQMVAQKSMFIDYNSSKSILCGSVTELNDCDIETYKLSLIFQMEEFKKIKSMRERLTQNNGQA